MPSDQIWHFDNENCIQTIVMNDNAWRPGALHNFSDHSVKLALSRCKWYVAVIQAYLFILSGELNGLVEWNFHCVFRCWFQRCTQLELNPDALNNLISMIDGLPILYGFPVRAFLPLKIIAKRNPKNRIDYRILSILENRVDHSHHAYSFDWSAWTMLLCRIDM